MVYPNADPNRMMLARVLSGQIPMVPTGPAPADPERIRVAEALKAKSPSPLLRKLLEKNKTPAAPAAPAEDMAPAAPITTPDGTEFVPFSGTSMQAQGLNRMVDQGKVDPTMAAEIAAGGGGIDVPAELAARIGMARSFLDGYPALEKAVQEGQTTGVLDQFTSRVLGNGPGAEVFRRLGTGQEALVRLLTGAAMTEYEARDYASRYSPELFNDTETALLKLQGLRRDLEYAMQAADLGRGVTTLLKSKGPPRPGYLLDGSIDPSGIKSLSDEDLLKMLEQN